MHSLRFLAPALVVSLLGGFAWGAAVEEVATANAAGKTVFLVVTDGPGPGLDAARADAKAAQAAAPNAAVVELDRRDPAQAASVAKYRVAAAPVPLILVVASNGIAVGGAKPGPGAKDRLVALIPSPKRAEYVKILAEQRVALVVIAKPDMPERSPLYERLGEVVKQLDGKAEYVLVDLDDKAEAKFVADFKPEDATRPLLVVVNPKGQALGRFVGAPTVEQVVTAARKKHCCSDPNCKDCGGK